MISTFILSFFVALITAIFSWLPVVTELPFGLDAYISTGMGYVSYIMEIFPPLKIMYLGFLWVLLWKTTLLLLRFLKIAI